MLYYMVLFGGIVIGGLVVFWLYKEAKTIGNRGTRNKGHRRNLNPTDHLNGAATNPAINNGTMSWGVEKGLAPKHPARTHAALPDKSTYWNWKLTGNGPLKTNVYAHTRVAQNPNPSFGITLCLRTGRAMERVSDPVAMEQAASGSEYRSSYFG